MMKNKLAFTITDTDDEQYILFTGDDIIEIMNSHPTFDEDAFFKAMVMTLSRPWVPAMAMDGTRVLLNTTHVKKVSARYPRQRSVSEEVDE